MGGQHSHYRVARAIQNEATAAMLTRAAQEALRRAAWVPCTCPHPPADHHGEDGCLNGWGEPPELGCLCMGNVGMSAGVDG